MSRRLWEKCIQLLRITIVDALVFIEGKAAFREWKRLLCMVSAFQIATGSTIESANSGQYS